MRHLILFLFFSCSFNSFAQNDHAKANGYLSDAAKEIWVHKIQSSYEYKKYFSEGHSIRVKFECRSDSGRLVDKSEVVLVPESKSNHEAVFFITGGMTAEGEVSPKVVQFSNLTVLSNVLNKQTLEWIMPVSVLLKVDEVKKPPLKLKEAAPLPLKKKPPLKLKEIAPIPLKKNSPSDFGVKFVYVAPGTFKMGDPNEGPQRRVVIADGFEIQATEVTQKQWFAVMKNNPSHYKCGNCPVEMVSWDDVQRFIKKLNALTKGMSGCIYRLPTSAEWEYAARAGTTTAYSFGNDVSKLKYYGWGSSDEPFEFRTHEVAQKKANPLGLYDMHGNVWEWVQDKYVDIKRGYGPGTNAHVIRGGAFAYRSDRMLTSAYSGKLEGPYSLTGFRLVRVCK